MTDEYIWHFPTYVRNPFRVPKHAGLIVIFPAVFLLLLMLMISIILCYSVFHYMLLRDLYTTQYLRLLGGLEIE